MKYEKVNPRKWQFTCAQSGGHPNWSFDNAREFASMMHKVGIEPWTIFPGTRQVMVETFDDVNAYQLSVLAETIQKSKLGSKVAKVWKSGSCRINIDYTDNIES